MTMKIFDKLIKRTRAYKTLETTSWERSSSLQRDAENLKREIRRFDVLKERVDEITRRMIKVRVEPDYDHRKYRVCADIDQDLIERYLQHGSDNPVIDAMGGSIGSQIAHEIKQMNYRRNGK